MDLGLNGKVAWVGGASKGLGRACAEALAKEGAKVVLSSRDEDSLDKTVAGLKAQGLVVAGVLADLGSPVAVNQAIDRAIELFGRIDIAVLSSGGPKPAKFMDLSAEDWSENYYGTLGYMSDICRRVLPGMAERKWGRIITITGIVASEPASVLALSSVFRGGVMNLVKIISQDFAKEGVTVNNVSPGAFKTDRAVQLMKDRSARTGESLEQIEADSVKNLPMGRYQAPEECGNVVAFLASELSSAITGSDIRVDGGIAKSI